MGCLSNDPVNSANFLRWYSALGVVLPVAGPLALCNAEFPAGSIGYAFPDLPAFLPVVRGEVLQFFFNSDEPQPLPADLRLGLLKGGQAVTGGFAAELTLYPYPGGFRFSGRLTIGSLPQGAYSPYLYAASQPATVLYLANPLQTVDHSKSWERETTIAEFSSPGSLAGVDYDALPGFAQRFRIPFALMAPKYPTEEEKYTDRNNVTRITRQGISRTYELRSDFLDQGLFEAAVLMLAHATHGTLLLNQRAYVVSSPLDVVDDYNEVGLLTVTGRVEDVAFARSLSAC